LHNVVSFNAGLLPRYFHGRFMFILYIIYKYSPRRSVVLESIVKNCVSTVR